MRNGRTDRCPHATAPTRCWPTWVGPSTVWRRPVYLDDDLYTRQPLCEAVQATGGNFIFVCKLSSHKTPSEYLHGVVPQETCQTAGRGSGKCHHRYQWMAGPPLRDGADALIRKVRKGRKFYRPDRLYLSTAC